MSEFLPVSESVTVDPDPVGTVEAGLVLIVIGSGRAGRGGTSGNYTFYMIT